MSLFRLVLPAVLVVMGLGLAGCGGVPDGASDGASEGGEGANGTSAGPPVAPAPGDVLPFEPRTYVAPYLDDPLRVDGRLDDAAWADVPWTEAYVDIRGPEAPAPRHRTRMKMAWDSTYFYVAARLEEPDVWGTITTRDAVIYQDNDFEVFIDPDGDTHNYYELEVNALETEWDLMLLKPYRDGGPAVDAWDIAGLKTAVDVDGTLNDPSDTDEGWSVELALPWSVLEEAAPHNGPPAAGEQWRMNFSRVQWRSTVENGRYRKKTDPSTGEPLPEDNWVWSPQGVVNMHLPERWGVVQFSTAGPGRTPAFEPNPTRSVRWALRRLYYRQRRHRERTGRYADALDALGADTLSVEGRAFEPRLETTASMYEITAPGANGTTVHVRHDGRMWVTGE